jgi:hypothetical protein
MAERRGNAHDLPLRIYTDLGASIRPGRDNVCGTTTARKPMRILIVLAVLSSFCGPALADSCTAQANAKKLHGAAEASFMKKCATDVRSKCDADAKAKNLHGAAAKSFTDKCVRDGTGT